MSMAPPERQRREPSGFVLRIIDDLRKRQARRPTPVAPSNAPLRKGYAVDPGHERRALAAGPRTEMTTTPQPFLEELYSSIDPIGYTGQKVGQNIGQRLPLSPMGKRVAGAVLGAGLDPLTYVGGIGGVKGALSVAAGVAAPVLADPYLSHLTPAQKAAAQLGIGLAAGGGTYGLASGAEALGRMAVLEPGSVPGQLLRAPMVLSLDAVGGKGSKPPRKPAPQGREAEILAELKRLDRSENLHVSQYRRTLPPWAAKQEARDYGDPVSPNSAAGRSWFRQKANGELEKALIAELRAIRGQSQQAPISAPGLAGLKAGDTLDPALSPQSLAAAQESQPLATSPGSGAVPTREGRRGQGPPPGGASPPGPPMGAMGAGAPPPPPLGSGITTTIRQRPTSWFQLEPFEAPGNRLVGPATAFEASIGKKPVLREAYEVIDPAAVHYSEPAANLGIKKQVYEETQKARAHNAVLDWWAEAQPLMGFDNKGVARKVKFAPGAGMIQSPARGTIMDIVENPLRYDLTPAQQSALEDAQALMDSVLASEKAAGVEVNVLADYWARIVTDDPGRQQSLLEKLRQAQGGPTMPGSKGHTKARTFDFAEDTIAAGFTLNTDPVQTLTNRLDAGIQAISNREATVRARQLPGIHFGAPALGESQLLTQFNPNAIQTWSAPRETVREVQKWLDLPEFNKPGGRNLAQEVLQAYRAAMVSFDLGSATLQTGRVAWRNPVAWTRAVSAGAQSMFQAPMTYISAHRGLIDRGIKNGAIIPPTEYLFPGRGIAQAVGGVPLSEAKTLGGKAYSFVSAPMRASNRFMQWNIFVAQTELYRAAEGMGGKGVADLVSLGKAIRHQTGTESYAILGVRQTQRDLEAMALFAPRFVRAIGNEIGQAFTGGPGGHEARRTLGTALAGMTALTAAANYAQGRSPNFTDPRSEDWARFKVGDSWVSAYGPLHNYLQTAARVAYYDVHGEFGKANTELGRFAQSKKGLALGFLIIGAELAVIGESSNFDGDVITRNPLTWRHALAGPITPTNIIEGLAASRAESLLNIANVTIRPESPRFTWREYVEGETGVPFDMLPWQRRRFYEKQDERGRALYKEFEKHYENAPADAKGAQQFHEGLILERIVQGQPVSVMVDDLDFLRSLRVKPNRIEDARVREVYRAFREAADQIEGTGFWDLQNKVPQYQLPEWRAAYDIWRNNQGQREEAMGLTPAELAHAKVIDAQVESMGKAMRRAKPDLETALVTYYARSPVTPEGARLKMRLDEQQARAARQLAEPARPVPAPGAP